MNIFNKEQRPIFIFCVSFTFMLLVAVISLTVSFVGGGLYPPRTESTSSTDGTVATTQPSLNVSLPNPPRVLGETEDAGNAYIDDIIFLGDSTTYHLIDRGVLSDGRDTLQVWGPSNGTLMLSPTVTTLKIIYPDTKEELTVAEAVARKQPKIMVLTVGLNGSHTFTESLYKGSYGKLIEAIKEASPSTKIILQSVFPVAANENTWTSLTPAELNLKIDQINQWAKDLTLEYENVRYLDTQSVLRNGENFLKDAYQVGDGIHLTKEAYLEILRYIRTHSWQ